MPSAERNIKTGLQFWFWLLIMGLALVPIYVIIWYVQATQMTIAGTLGAGAIALIVLLSLGAFVLLLWIYGWIINTKIRRS